MCNNINWPTNLIEELAYRRCILFLGSGISATAKTDEGKSPLIWGDFLQNAKSLIHNITTEDDDFIKKMLDQENYMVALQVIYNLADLGEYNKYLKDIYSRPSYLPSEVHKAIKEIDSKIVITTNFDSIYDQLCNQPGYVICNHREAKTIISNIKSPENIIIKAHGDLKNTDYLTFTAKQYYEAQAYFPDFYSLLSALFLTHTVIFMGYSLNDPDVNLILRNITNASPQNVPNYIILKEGVSEHLKSLWKDTYNMSVLEYGPDYSYFNQNIMGLRDEVLTFRSERNMP